MIDIQNIFKHCVVNEKALLEERFELINNEYTKEYKIYNNQFIMRVYINKESEVHFKLFDSFTNDEYVLIHMPKAKGKFIGELRSACEDILVNISLHYFTKERYLSKSTQEIVDFIKSEYDVEPEFPWEKYSEYAVFRAKENSKWFAIIMEVEKTKLGLQDEGTMLVINLKDTPSQVEEKIAKEHYFPAYHMNKKHWYSLNLDVNKNEIIEAIRQSYKLVTQ